MQLFLRKILAHETETRAGKLRENLETQVYTSSKLVSAVSAGLVPSQKNDTRE